MQKNLNIVEVIDLEDEDENDLENENENDSNIIYNEHKRYKVQKENDYFFNIDFDSDNDDNASIDYNNNNNRNENENENEKEEEEFTDKEIVSLKSLRGNRNFITTKNKLIIRNNELCNKCEREREGDPKKNCEECNKLVEKAMDKIMTTVLQTPYGLEIDIMGISSPYKDILRWIDNSNYVSLTFTMCKFTVCGLSSIANLFQNFNRDISTKKKFALCGNEFVDDVRGNKFCNDQICSIVFHGDFIENIDLSSNHIDSKGFNQIVDTVLSLNGKSKLQSLDLSDNDVEIASIFYLLDLLGQMEKENNFPMILFKDNFGYLERNACSFSDYLPKMCKYLTEEKVSSHIVFFNIMKQMMSNRKFIRFFESDVFYKPKMETLINFKMDTYNELINLNDERSDLAIFRDKFNQKKITKKTKSILIHHTSNPKELENSLFKASNTLKNIKKISIFY